MWHVHGDSLQISIHPNCCAYFFKLLIWTSFASHVPFLIYFLGCAEVWRRSFASGRQLGRQKIPRECKRSGPVSCWTGFACGCLWSQTSHLHTRTIPWSTEAHPPPSMPYSSVFTVNPRVMLCHQPAGTQPKQFGLSAGMVTCSTEALTKVSNRVTSECTRMQLELFCQPQLKLFDLRMQSNTSLKLIWVRLRFSTFMSFLWQRMRLQLLLMLIIISNNCCLVYWDATFHNLLDVSTERHWHVLLPSQAWKRQGCRRWSLKWPWCTADSRVFSPILTETSLENELARHDDCQPLQILRCRNKTLHLHCRWKMWAHYCISALAFISQQSLEQCNWWRREQAHPVRRQIHLHGPCWNCNVSMHCTPQFPVVRGKVYKS